MAKIEHRPTARVLNILELLAANQEGLTLTEIAEAIDAPKSSVLPLIHTMAQRKFIFFDVHTYKYSIGIGSFCVGSAYTSNMNALQFIKSEMKYIVKKTNEICQMGIFDRGQVLYVAKVDSDDPIRIISYVGKRLPAYCTALGKALLCQKNIKELKKLYPDGLKKYTPNTITDFEVLADQLKEIKQTMIATENGEVNEQSDCISVPLFKGDDILAAISVSVPSFRMTEEKTELIKSMLLETKTKIETFFREHDIDSTQLTLSN
ncbi:MULTISPECIES: IclR family transcriptional regulator [Fusobacterium]|jgi:IclR family KDG regulon transcriptional repressor|uniref:IclR family transcriptional regulator n=1 Tax=Fusobacterium TaxID=848 RepID=UPI000E415277|nr:MULTISPECIES: IclR family transcriptional regulator [Fusobacterium]MCD7979122.1 IclR family transcriptional regulator [Fusobacterium sp.]MCF0169121.1 IclR family transcriptional regulator [Fusobacterium varium]MCF2672206.1 IclR family transcriptional regulator [Fusobacterium varium]MCI6031917.1 IclR family transcriptional regulator [Fusobacterium varium]MDY4004568.1 IclR family transcriptional regulator [Fusobacterium varium]